MSDTGTILNYELSPDEISLGNDARQRVVITAAPRAKTFSSEDDFNFDSSVGDDQEGADDTSKRVLTRIEVSFNKPTGEGVPLTALEVVPAAHPMTLDPGDNTYGPLKNWSFSAAEGQDGAVVTLVAKPDDSKDALELGANTYLWLIIDSVLLEKTPGPTPISIKEFTKSAKPDSAELEDPPLVVRDLTKTVAFIRPKISAAVIQETTKNGKNRTGNADLVPAGSKVSLIWSGDPKATYYITSSVLGPAPVKVTESPYQVDTPLYDKINTFVLTAERVGVGLERVSSGDGDDNKASCTVQVYNPAPEIEYFCVGKDCVWADEQVTLRWKTKFTSGIEVHDITPHKKDSDNKIYEDPDAKSTAYTFTPGQSSRYRLKAAPQQGSTALTVHAEIGVRVAEGIDFQSTEFKLIKPPIDSGDDQIYMMHLNRYMHYPTMHMLQGTRRSYAAIDRAPSRSPSGLWLIATPGKGKVLFHYLDKTSKPQFAIGKHNSNYFTPWTFSARHTPVAMASDGTIFSRVVLPQDSETDECAIHLEKDGYQPNPMRLTRQSSDPPAKTKLLWIEAYGKKFYVLTDHAELLIYDAEELGDVRSVELPVLSDKSLAALTLVDGEPTVILALPFGDHFHDLYSCQADGKPKLLRAKVPGVRAIDVSTTQEVIITQQDGAFSSYHLKTQNFISGCWNHGKVAEWKIVPNGFIYGVDDTGKVHCFPPAPEGQSFLSGSTPQAQIRKFEIHEEDDGTFVADTDIRGETPISKAKILPKPSTGTPPVLTAEGPTSFTCYVDNKLPSKGPADAQSAVLPFVSRADPDFSEPAATYQFGNPLVAVTPAPKDAPNPNEVYVAQLESWHSQATEPYKIPNMLFIFAFDTVTYKKRIVGNVWLERGIWSIKMKFDFRDTLLILDTMQSTLYSAPAGAAYEETPFDPAVFGGLARNNRTNSSVITDFEPNQAGILLASGNQAGIASDAISYALLGSWQKLPGKIRDISQARSGVAGPNDFEVIYSDYQGVTMLGYTFRTYNMYDYLHEVAQRANNSTFDAAQSPNWAPRNLVNTPGNSVLVFKGQDNRGPQVFWNGLSQFPFKRYTQNGTSISVIETLLTQQSNLVFRANWKERYGNSGRSVAAMDKGNGSLTWLTANSGRVMGVAIGHDNSLFTVSWGGELSVWRGR